MLENDPDRSSRPLPAFKRLGGLLFWLAVWVVIVGAFWVLMTAGAGE